MNPLIIIFILVYALVLVIVSRSKIFLKFSAEVRRKTIHILGGTSSLFIPKLFNKSILDVTLVFLLLLAFFTLIKLLPKLKNYFKASIYAVSRSDYAEYYFIISIYIVYLLTINQDYIYYFVPVSLLTFSDSFSSLIGIKYGRIKIMNKTLEGSISGGTISLIIVTIALAQFTSLSMLSIVYIALILAILSMFLELILNNGYDNLAIPLFSYFLLNLLLKLPLIADINFYIMIILILIFVISSSISLTSIKQSIIAILVISNILMILNYYGYSQS